MFVGIDGSSITFKAFSAASCVALGNTFFPQELI
jgi:hypothetical protein